MRVISHSKDFTYQIPHADDHPHILDISVEREIGSQQSVGNNDVRRKDSNRN